MIDMQHLLVVVMAQLPWNRIKAGNFEKENKNHAGIWYPARSHQDGAAVPRIESLPGRIQYDRLRHCTAPADAGPGAEGVRDYP